MSSYLVLIADGNTGRGQRIANALEAAGRPCRVAPHGAAALEIALSERPRVVVARSELPLVDARKLAEILRANPRTRSARFLFFGGSGQPADPMGGVGDLTLESDAETDRVLEAVEILLERQARIERLEQSASAEHEFEGRLADLSPVELLQMLHLRHSTGRLTLTPELDDGRSPAGAIFVVKGEIHAAESDGIRAEKALFRMLDWRVGDFHFEPTEVEAEAEIKAPTRTVLAEGQRQLDEWNRLAPKLPPFESPVKMRVGRDELPEVVHPLTQEVLGLIAEAESVGEVVDRSGYPDYQVLRTLHTLADRGIVEFGRARIATPQHAGHALFNDAQCRRLRSFVQIGLGRDVAVPDAKLLVVAAGEDVVERFAGLLAKVPGAEMAPRFERGRIGAADLESMARIDVDGDFAIELVQLPADPAHAALWPFAAHRALGTIFLLDARMGESAAGLAEIGAALTGAPGARSFHVVLLGPGERLSPDELRANLSLLDEASLFLLPIDPDKNPSALLRSLFARIVP
ncbi:MAG: DUF4388 domain-containing protein [Spirochaetaceae bacterium]|nr:DUF4388 domain-containing protein [Myxococcales bacterium]MCB9725394.1 DUF4388 domain-containing protein [Spirochaetaceae bacterium]HPG26499.1 DUF4388 domain-containing protein [Myxococcota bacterium]